MCRGVERGQGEGKSQNRGRHGRVRRLMERSDCAVEVAAAGPVAGSAGGTQFRLRGCTLPVLCVCKSDEMADNGTRLESCL